MNRPSHSDYYQLDINIDRSRLFLHVIPSTPPSPPYYFTLFFYGLNITYVPSLVDFAQDIPGHWYICYIQPIKEQCEEIRGGGWKG